MNRAVRSHPIREDVRARFAALRARAYESVALEEALLRRERAAVGRTPKPGAPKGAHAPGTICEKHGTPRSAASRGARGGVYGFCRQCRIEHARNNRSRAGDPVGVRRPKREVVA